MAKVAVVFVLAGMAVLGTSVPDRFIDRLIDSDLNLVYSNGTRLIPLGGVVNVHISQKVSVPSGHHQRPTITTKDEEPVTCFEGERSSVFSYYNKLARTWPASTSQYTGLNVSTIDRGSLYSDSYALYFQNEQGPISPFHDIPLFANENNKIFNMVVEVPRWTNAKMEIATKEPLNPIKQDTKKGKLRYVANCFPHHGYIWNYGALPQTWEDPNHSDEATGCRGDNDPIDVCEIGHRVAKRGDVIQVKVLGTVALIDEGETDWKLIAIDVNDPLAPQLSDISDVEKHMPGFLKATEEWFRIYKIPDGKPENQFAFNGEAKNREFAHKVIEETHAAWQALVEGTADAGGLTIECVTVPQAANKLNTVESKAIVDASPPTGPAQAIDSKVDTWHYVQLK